MIAQITLNLWFIYEAVSIHSVSDFLIYLVGVRSIGTELEWSGICWDALRVVFWKNESGAK